MVASGMLFLFFIAVAVLANRAVWLGLKRGYTPFRCIAASSVTLIGMVFLTVLISSGFSDQNLIALWQQEFDKSLKSSLEVYQQMGWPAEELERAGRLVRIFFRDALFAWISIFLVLFSGASYFIQRRMMPDLPGSALPVLRFEGWRLPDQTIWFFIAAMVLLVFGTRLWHPAYLVGLNMMVLLAHGYGAIGLAIIFFFINKKKLPVLVKGLVVLVVGLVPVLMVVVLFIGLLDTWRDWRKQLSTTESSDDQ